MMKLALKSEGGQELNLFSAISILVTEGDFKQGTIECLPDGRGDYSYAFTGYQEVMIQILGEIIRRYGCLEDAIMIANPGDLYYLSFYYEPESNLLLEIDEYENVVNLD